MYHHQHINHIIPEINCMYQTLLFNTTWHFFRYGNFISERHKAYMGKLFLNWMKGAFPLSLRTNSFYWNFKYNVLRGQNIKKEIFNQFWWKEQTKRDVMFVKHYNRLTTDVNLWYYKVLYVFVVYGIVWW